MAIIIVFFLLRLRRMHIQSQARTEKTKNYSKAITCVVDVVYQFNTYIYVLHAANVAGFCIFYFLLFTALSLESDLDHRRSMISSFSYISRCCWWPLIPSKNT